MKMKPSDNGRYFNVLMLMKLCKLATPFDLTIQMEVAEFCFRVTLFNVLNLAPVFQRPDNFIQWISYYPTVSICAKISVFHLVQVNMHTLTNVNFGRVRKPWTTFNEKYILEHDGALSSG